MVFPRIYGALFQARLQLSETEASEEVAQNMERITQLIERNLLAAQQTKQATNELLDTSGNLKTLIGGFQIHKG